MQSRYLALFIFSILAFNAFGQQGVIKERAQAMVTNTLNDDFGALADYTYPKVLQAMGGREKMIGVLKASTAQMKAQGATIKSGTIGEPGPVIKKIKAWFSVVPEDIALSVKDGELWSSSNLLAVSEDKGKKWTFIDVGNMSDQTLHSLFPELKDLSIPKQSQPVFHPAKG